MAFGGDPNKLGAESELGDHGALSVHQHLRAEGYAVGQ